MLKKKFKFKILKLLTLNFALLTCLISVTPTWAAESTQSASPSATIKAKLQALQAEISSKAAKLTAQISKKLQNRAYIGFVVNKSEKNLTLNTKTGSKSANLNQFTQYQGKNFAYKSMNHGDYIAILGDIDENSILTANKVIKLAKPDSAEKQIIWGQVVKKELTQISLKLADGKQVTLDVLPTTKYQMDKNPAGFNDVQVDKNIIAVALKTDLKYKIRFIYIPKPATPSAQQR